MSATDTKGDSTDRCSASRRCRQPVVFYIDINSWRSLACEKHLGLLASRLLTNNPYGIKVTLAVSG